MSFKAIYPTIAHSITELFFLPIQNMLKINSKKENHVKEDAIHNEQIHSLQAPNSLKPLEDMVVPHHRKPFSESTSRFSLARVLSVILT